MPPLQIRSYKQVDTRLETTSMALRILAVDDFEPWRRLSLLLSTDDSAYRLSSKRQTALKQFTVLRTCSRI